MLRCQLANLFRKKVGAVRDRVVIKHAREIGRAEYRFDVCLHLAPIALIDVRRQHHQTTATSVRRTFRQIDRFGSAQRRDRRDYRHSITDRLNDGGPKRQLLVVRECGAFAKGAWRHDSGATIIDQPVAMFRRKHVIDVQMFVERCGNGGHHAAPGHVFHKFLKSQILDLRSQ